MDKNARERERERDILDNARVRQTNECASADGHKPTQSMAKGYMIKLYEYL